MNILTRDALLRCKHGTGKVALDPLLQHLVTVAGRAVLVDDDPEQKQIDGCSNSVPLAGILPCKLTLKAHTGYSSLLRIDGRRVCHSELKGFTTGTPPGSVFYSVADPGQTLVSET